MSEESRAVPIPRPRQLKSTSDETDSASKVYENFTIKPLPSDSSTTSVYDQLNAQLSELRAEAQKPLPTPRTKVVAKRNYENSPDFTRLNNLQQPDLPPKTTGAIRKTTNIPKVENNLNDAIVDEDKNDKSQHDLDEVLSMSSSTSGKSNSEKFITPNPS
jgi:hypothetical protein